MSSGVQALLPYSGGKLRKSRCEFRALCWCGGKGGQGTQSWGMCVLSRLTRVRLFATLWTVERPGSSVLGILQARILQRVASSFSRGSSRPRDGVVSLASPALAGVFFTTSATWEVLRMYAAAKLLSRQSCSTLCDPIDGSPPGSRPWDSPGKHTGVGYHFLLQCMKMKSESEVAQSCLILRDPMDCSLPGSSVHGISQARVLEWVAIAFSAVVS